MRRYEPQKEEIISAGIDIGTSTTKVVISKFSLMNMAGGTHLPRIEIVDKEIIHRSPIYRTPLLSVSRIDIEAVQKLVKKEYDKAGIEIGMVQTGAVIITGETATKSNAEQMIHELSNEAGEFLVATAGPDLEGIIAAKGSGAYQYSKKTGRTIANIDIGGGTANVAVYRNGKLQGTCTLHIGGRLVEFRENRIFHISNPVKKLIEKKSFPLSEGDLYRVEDMKEMTNELAKILARMLHKQLSSTDKVLLLGHEPNWDGEIDVLMFSGGVAECLYRLEDASSYEIYEDIGMLLAESLKNSKELSEWEWIVPDETVRATVLGAGTQTTEISGATIQVDPSQLPLKNLPVYQFSFENDVDEGVKRIPTAIMDAVNIYDPQREGINFALYLTDIPYLSFQKVQKLALALLTGVRGKPNQNQPFVVVLESDHAKVLGQTLNFQEPSQPVICIDQIVVEHGDYLDIGNVLQSEVVPVVIKTLTFHT